MQLKYNELYNFLSFSTSRRFKVKKSYVFGDIMPRSTLKVSHCFRRTCFPQCQGWAVQTTKKQHMKPAVNNLLHSSFLLNLHFNPQRWRQYVPLKSWLTFSELHGIWYPPLPPSSHFYFILTYKFLKINFIYCHHL